MADLKMRWSADERRYVLVLDESGEPELDHGVVRTAVTAALLTWARAHEGDPLPGFDGDRKGHWADPYDPRGRKGSRAWLLAGRIITERTLQDARIYLQEALDSLIPAWIAAHSVTVWRSGIRTIAAKVVCKLPDGREEAVEIDNITGD